MAVSAEHGSNLGSLVVVKFLDEIDQGRPSHCMLFWIIIGSLNPGTIHRHAYPATGTSCIGIRADSGSRFSRKSRFGLIYSAASANLKRQLETRGILRGTHQSSRTR